MGNLNNQTWDELWNSPEAEKGLIYGCLYVQLSGRKAYMFHIKQK
jgi:hypothetical protein